MTDERFFIYPYNWWNGFYDKTDANHIGFFEMLFSNTKLKNFEITYDINKANVLLEAGKPDANIRNSKNWKYKINFVGEPDLPFYENYDLVLTSVNRIKNIVDLPLSVAYIHCNFFYPILLNRDIVKNIPSDFCSFIVSNPKCEIRNKLFERLNQYKKVNSMGRYANNVGNSIHYSYWSNEYLDIIGKHKFMICCENTKMETYTTEKIVNPYLAKTIPIYWGSHNIKNIFNPDSLIFLEDETEESMDKLIEKVIELDNDEEKYLEFINRPIFIDKNIQYWKEHYTLESLGKKIDKIITNEEVTLFITSCGRPNLLKRTLESFVKYNTYPIKEVILCEDSGIKGVVDFAKDILPYPIIFCYNETCIGQIKTIEKYTPLIKTKWVFHLEDDYEFFDSDFIELSIQIMHSDPKISQVLLEDEQHNFHKIDIGNPLCYKVMTNEATDMYCNYGDGPLSCFSWRPSLKKIEIQKLRMPYELWDDEYTIQLQINKMGMYSVVTKNEKNGRKGFCTHIGKNFHISNTDNGIKIIGRHNFPDKIQIRLKDI